MKNRQMVWRIKCFWGVLVSAQFHFELVDYSDEYRMKSVMNRYLVNDNIASFGCSNMWWKGGTPVQRSTRSISAMPYISLCVNLTKLLSHVIFIVYFQCGIVTLNSANGIPVIRCTWTSLCDSYYLLLVYCRCTWPKNWERIWNIHWIYNAA